MSGELALCCMVACGACFPDTCAAALNMCSMWGTLAFSSPYVQKLSCGKTRLTGDCGISDSKLPLSKVREYKLVAWKCDDDRCVLPSFVGSSCRELKDGGVGWL